MIWSVLSVLFTVAGGSRLPILESNLFVPLMPLFRSIQIAGCSGTLWTVRLEYCYSSGALNKRLWWVCYLLFYFNRVRSTWQNWPPSLSHVLSARDSGSTLSLLFLHPHRSFRVPRSPSALFPPPPPPAHTTKNSTRFGSSPARRCPSCTATTCRSRAWGE